MKMLVVTRVLLIIVAVVSLFAVSCSKEIVRTVTVNNVIPVTSQNVIITTTMPSTVITPVFTQPPPDIPHVYLINQMGNPYIQGLIAASGAAICFECHGMPAQHQMWEYDPTACLDCHRESPNPVLNP